MKFNEKFITTIWREFQNNLQHEKHLQKQNLEWDNYAIVSRITQICSKRDTKIHRKITTAIEAILKLVAGTGRCFLRNITTAKNSLPELFRRKSVYKILEKFTGKHHRCCDSDIGVFPWVLRNISEHLSFRIISRKQPTLRLLFVQLTISTCTLLLPNLVSNRDEVVVLPLWFYPQKWFVSSISRTEQNRGIPKISIYFD